MPRLIGKQSSGSWSTTLVLILAIATAGSLEYLGLINVIPGFGRDLPLNDQSSLPINRGDGE